MSRQRATIHAVLALGSIWLACRVALAQEPLKTPISASPASTSVTAVPPAPDLSAFVGRVIQGVDVVIDDDTWDDVKVPVVRTVRQSDPFTPALARRALTEVLDSGAFARGRVSVVAEGVGVRIVCRVVPRKQIETLRLDLHGARIERDELLREADLVEGGELVGRDIPEQKKRLETVLARHGYPSPVINLTTRGTDSPNRVIVLLDIAPGVARRLQRRVFYVFDADPRALAETNETYSQKVGQRADEGQLDKADVGLAAALRSKGYHHADVSHDVVVDNGLVTLRVRVDAGPLFVTRFEGTDSFDPDALNGALGLEDETDRTPGHLTQKVRDFYVKHGFLDAEVSIEMRGAGAGSATPMHGPGAPSLVYLVFHVVEHDRVAVVSRSYPCLKPEVVRKLSGGGPSSPKDIGNEIDSYLEEELPGADLFKNPHPRGLDLLLQGQGEIPEGARALPIDLDPDATYVADTYDRAVLHIQELYRNEGFLHAQVGPVEVVRRRCDARSPPGQCIPVPLPHPPVDVCAYDPTNLPLPNPPLDPALTCVPDPAHGVECEPFVALRIPIKLGPRTTLYDLGFTGARSIPQRVLAAATNLTLGDPANVLKLEEARRHLLDAYKEEGFAYADVKYTLDSSLDHTRARARFDIVEGDRVVVRQIIIRGNDATNEGVIRRRIALAEGKPYRTSLVRKTQERIATLNVFSSVNVVLEDPYVPQDSKNVIITVVEVPSQYIEVRPGISTGEGFRLAFEYGDRNIARNAIGFSFRVQLSYLPNALILDPQVYTNFNTLSDGERIATRTTASFAFPDVGLGPLVRGTIDGVFVRSLQRDFELTKGAGIVSGFYRPFRELQFTLSPDVEYNVAHVFQFPTIGQYIQSQGSAGVNPDLFRLLRVPDGPSYAIAQRLVVTFDRRDNAFNAHRGTYLVSGAEHVDWYGLDPSSSSEGHFIRFTETVAAYLPVSKTITLAAELRAGVNVQTTPGSVTYPDRLFFLGGIESMRGWLQDTYVPQEFADRIAADFGKAGSDSTKFTINDVVLRGGNLMINPRLELRIPVRPPFETVLFGDAGNLWVDPTYILQHPEKFNLRYAVGSGIRFQTPIGPLVFDYGINMSRLVSSSNDPRRTYEDFGAFHFAIGLF